MHLSELKDEIKHLLKAHEITVARQKFKSSAGRAQVEERIIKVPRITDLYSAAVVIHEIAHVILEHDLQKTPEYIIEYETEKWTIKFLRICDMHKDYRAEFRMYIRDAKLNVKDHLIRYKKTQKAKGLDAKVNERIRKWACS